MTDMKLQISQGYWDILVFHFVVYSVTYQNFLIVCFVSIFFHILIHFIGL